MKIAEGRPVGYFQAVGRGVELGSTVKQVLQKVASIQSGT